MKIVQLTRWQYEQLTYLLCSLLKHNTTAVSDIKIELSVLKAL